MSGWAFSLVKSVVERHPKIATAYRRFRDQLDYDDEPLVTPWGFKLAGNVAMARGQFEPVETRLLRQLLGEVDMLVNVGANVGYYCCHALSLGKHVIAFEPIERNLRYLYKNIKANSWSDIEIYPLALADRTGILEIYGSDTGASMIKGWANIPESYVTLVPVSTMDLTIGERLHGMRSVILVDIEGAERWMLDGASRVLTNDPKPVWVIEITTKQNQPKGVPVNPNVRRTFELLFENGYQARCFDAEMRPITICAVDDAIAGALDLPTYNFIFREQKGRQ